MYFTRMSTKIDKLAASARIGRRIAYYRNRAGLTQVELAGRLGITQALLACYETGKRNIPVGLLEPCSEILDGDVSSLFEETPDKPVRRRKPGPRSKLERQIDELRRLPESQQQLVSDVIDTVLLASEKNR